MHLEELTDLALVYDGDDPVVVRPFGAHEGQGFGLGTGSASGRLAGAVRWANFPRRREDGVWLPDLRGVITTAEGPVLWELHGISLPPDEQEQRHLVGSVRFFAEAPAHRWLNDSAAVHQGVLDLEADLVRLPIWVCRPDRGRPAD